MIKGKMLNLSNSKKIDKSKLTKDAAKLISK